MRWSHKMRTDRALYMIFFGKAQTFCKKWPEESPYKEEFELFRISNGVRLVGVVEQ